MATNTYVALSTVTAPGSGTSQLVMSSIPSGYTDLRMVISGITSTTGYAFTLGVNGDTGSNYSQTLISGNGTNAQSTRYANATNASMYLGGWVNGYSSTAPTTITVDFMNYANTTTYKSILWRSSIGTRNSEAGVILWRGSTGSAAQAITSITVYAQSGSTIAAGSTFSLYGIAAEGTSPAPKATGGAIYSDTDYYYHVFGSTGVFTPSQALSCDVLTVAGGGGGGYHGGAGGGAGGLLYSATQSLSNGVSYTATVGAGGAGGSNGTHAANGTNSTLAGSGFTTLTATGGGGAGGYLSLPYTGNNGGSGGGGWGTSVAGTGQSGQGFDGGNGAPGGSYNEGSGGGGGAGAVGQAASAGVYMGAGGVGSSTYNSWFAVTGVGQNVSGTYYIAGGGGGGMAGNSNATAGVGGYGGGGAGATKSITLNGTSGTANTGGGGGGGAYNGTPGTIGTPGSGGSGVLIIRYLKA